MAADPVLLVAGRSPADAGEDAAVRATCEELGLSCGRIDADVLADRLDAEQPPGEAPSVIVLLPSVAGALPLARRLHLAWPDSYLLVVRSEQELPAFQAGLGVAPMLGRLWALASASPAQVGAALRQAATSARQRQQLRTTLDSANARLAETRSVALGDYQRLLASEHHLANFLRNAQAAVLGVDGGGRVLFWSEGAAALLGVAVRDALGRTLEEFGSWGQALAEAIQRVGRASARELVELPMALRGEQRVVEAVLSATAGDAHGPGTSVVLRDVTARRRAQDQLREANLQLQREVSQRTHELEQSQLALMQAQKLEAIGKLTGGVAHDFNNVLQVIGSNLQLMQPLVGGTQEAARLLRAALAAVDRGAKLSSQLLAFARRQPLDPVPLNVGRRVREMDDLLRRALGEQVEVETSLAGGLWTTLVDGNQLENVILNLAINSRDAMPHGGRLTIETANVVLDEEYTRGVPDLAPGQYVMLAVSDTGEGMPPEVAAQAFEPFFTTKPEGKGTGLGLSMAYGFAKQSGGHIRIYSEPGQGTTIRLYLPRSHEKELQAPPPAPGPVQGGSETVLVVEDDLAVQAAVVSMLQSLGYRVLRANDAQAALSILQSGVHVDVLFTDVVMPGPLRSPELAQRARHLLPAIAVLFTSGYTQNAIVHGGRLDPGVELLSKPYRQEDLARKIRQVLQNRQQALRALPTPPAAAQARAPTGPLRVLLVEDEADLREVAQQMLELLGCQVQAVASAEAAEDALRVDSFDLMMTDISLPGRDGLQLAQAARAAHPRLQVVISSGYGHAADAGGLESLPKPYGLPELQALVERAQAATA